VAVTHHIGPLGQRGKGVPVAFGTHGDHLAMGAMDGCAAVWQPGQEGLIHRPERVELAPVQHMGADDLDLPLDPAFGLGPPRPAQPDGELVVAGERDRLGVQRGRLAAADVATHYGLGPVIEDRRRHAAEVREAPPVAVPEAGQVLRRRIAAERVARVRQHHVEAEGVQRPGGGLDLTLVTPVDLGLGASQDLKAPVQVGRVGRCPDHTVPVLAHIDLDPLVVAVEAVVGDQPLIDRDRLELRLLSKPGVDQVGVRVDLAGTTAPAGQALAGSSSPRPAGSA
jgi:hypothetical protein